jgi:hypothetical protein
MMVGKEEQALDNVQQKVWNLENITRGNFAVTKPLVYDNTKQEAKE